MKKRLLFFYLLLLACTSYAQDVAILNIAEAPYITKQKFDSYIYKKGFVAAGTAYKTDTIVRDFDFRMVKKGKAADSIPVQRSITSFITKEDFSFTYTTTSLPEFEKIKKDIKKEGFFSYQEKDGQNAAYLLYQHNDVTVTISQKPLDTLTAYSFCVKKQELPKPKEISFAEDLFAFNSHEYLRYYFGDANVKKDIYYLSEKQIGNALYYFPTPIGR